MNMGDRVTRHGSLIKEREKRNKRVVIKTKGRTKSVMTLTTSGSILYRKQDRPQIKTKNR